LSDEQSVFEIIEGYDAQGVWVRLRGELDLAGAPALAERLCALGEGRESVVLDLDELAFIDMSGLRVVLAAVENFSKNASALTVTRGSPQVRRLIALVDVDVARMPVDGSPA
jgi:anti-sigma B factor antagonist